MKIYVIVLLILTSFQNIHAQSWLWAKSAGGIGDDEGHSVAIDPGGNVCVTGIFGTISITIGTTTLTNKGSNDIFVAKYDPNGNVLWAKSIGGVSYEFTSGIATDASGNIYVTGYFSSPSITLGSLTLTKIGGNDIFIVKYDTNGNELWAKCVGGAGDDNSYGIATDAGGNVYVTGVFNSASITFGSTTLNNAGNADLFIAKFDAGGNVLWAKSAGGSSYDYSRNITTDANGNVYIIGNFNSPSLTFGSTTLTNAGSYDVFIAKYDSGGNALWAKGPAGSNEERGWDIATDAGGNVYAIGDFLSSSLVFGSITLTNLGSFDIFITKYDGNGNMLWAKSAGGSSDEEGHGIATDASGNVYVTGDFKSPSITFGSTTLTNTGGYDIFSSKYDTNGNVSWAISANGSGYDFGLGIATDAGNAYITGCFQVPSITFGSTTLTNAGFYDFFVTRLNTVTGIAEPFAKSNFSIFPNPSNGIMNITLDKNINQGVVNVFNVLGYKVYSEALIGNEKTLNLDIAPGIYFVMVDSGEEKYVQKIIIQ